MSVVFMKLKALINYRIGSESGKKVRNISNILGWKNRRQQNWGGGDEEEGEFSERECWGKRKEGMMEEI